MTAECARLGGHGVVGVRLSRGSCLLGGLEFTAIGTAVWAADAGCGRRGLFTSDLSGQDFARLIMGAWVPAGLALGISIGSWHDDPATTRQARWGSGSAEVSGWTGLVNQVRDDARRQLESGVQRLGAEGAVIAAVQLRVRGTARPAQAAAITSQRQSWSAPPSPGSPVPGRVTQGRPWASCRSARDGTGSHRRIPATRIRLEKHGGSEHPSRQ